jgi:hypothetical protein
MADIKQRQQAKPDPATGHIGAVIGVGFVGIVILVSYISLYALYMARV